MRKSPASVLFVVATFTMLVQFASIARAEFIFGEPVRFPAPINSGSWDMSPVISPNNLELYLTSVRSDFGTYVAQRGNPSDPFGSPAKVLSGFGHNSISADGLNLYGNANNSAFGGLGESDIWEISRPSPESPWDIGSRSNLGESINSSQSDRWPAISPDGTELYFTRTVTDDSTSDADIWVSRRSSPNAAFEPATKLPENINVGFASAPSLSPDGLTLFFTSDRDGGYGFDDIWVSHRADENSPWEDPMNLGATINSSRHEWSPSMSPDGRTLLFSRGATYDDPQDLWYANVIPEPTTITLALLAVMFLGGWRRRLSC